MGFSAFVPSRIRAVVGAVVFDDVFSFQVVQLLPLAKPNLPRTSNAKLLYPCCWLALPNLVVLFVCVILVVFFMLVAEPVYERPLCVYR